MLPQVEDRPADGVTFSRLFEEALPTRVSDTAMARKATARAAGRRAGRTPVELHSVAPSGARHLNGE